MRIDVFHHFVSDPVMSRIETKLDQILAHTTHLVEKDVEMSAQLDRLTAEVSENNDAIQSAVTLLGSLSQLIRDALADSANTETKLTELADTLDANSNSLAAAVVANTPSAPEEPAPTE